MGAGPAWGGHETEVSKGESGRTCMRAAVEGTPALVQHSRQESPHSAQGAPLRASPSFSTPGWACFTQVGEPGP